MCPSSGEIAVSVRRLVFVTLRKVDSLKLQGLNPCNFKLSTCFIATNTKCRTDTVISPDDGHIVARNTYRKEINTLKNCAPSWLYLQDYEILKLFFVANNPRSKWQRTNRALLVWFGKDFPISYFYAALAPVWFARGLKPRSLV